VAESFNPTTPEEVERVVAWAAGEERPLEVAGNGSKQALGRPVEAGHRLELGWLSGIKMYEPEELVMTAAAGTPLREIEAELAESRQELAFEPADYGAILGGEPGRQTIGGVFACNLSGPRRIKAGAARDHLLGIQAVTGRGDLIKSGGRVVKNVTGYDLSKLLAGSFGTVPASATRAGAVFHVMSFSVHPVPVVWSEAPWVEPLDATWNRTLALCTGSTKPVTVNLTYEFVSAPEACSTRSALL